MKTVNTLFPLFVLLILMAGFVPEGEAQQKANYDEDKIPKFQLPDPLLFSDGSIVTKTDWPKRREEILELFKKHVYGTMPEPPPKNFRAIAGTGERTNKQYESIPDWFLSLAQPVPRFSALSMPTMNTNYAIQGDNQTETQ